jgi:TatD DNase family protein
MDVFDADRREVLERAASEGIELFITVPARRGDAPACLSLAEEDPRIFATAGLHPHEARLWGSETRDELLAALASPRTLAVGEIGLDHHYDLSPRPVQAQAFREQIDIARRAGRPLVIHTRSARAEPLSILKEEAREAGRRSSLLHGGCSHARRCSISASTFPSGMLTFPKAAGFRTRLGVCRPTILVETDAPYLAPVPTAGLEPAFLPSTIPCRAEVRIPGVRPRSP